MALKVRRKPKSKKVRQSKRALGMSVEERSEAVDASEEFDHWEIDSTVGKKSDKAAVLTIIERMTRCQIAVKLVLSLLIALYAFSQ
ncbi:MAG: hypothetical protein LBU32_01625 [Clostridiales bacterium]|nr:hypothetical protein [Clostridiales bacterium]